MTNLFIISMQKTGIIYHSTEYEKSYLVFASPSLTGAST